MKFIVMVILIFITLLLLFWFGMVRTNYPQGEQLSIHGPYVSHHQGYIAWEKIPTKYQFVFMKATEGGDFVDPRFHENWRFVKGTHLRYGAYHFYRLNKSGMEQAQNFISVVPKDTTALPPVIDLEIFEKNPTGKSDIQIQSEIQDFLTTLEGYYGKKPIIYTTYEFHRKYLGEHFSGYSLWIRDIWRKPRISQRWHFWQYNNRGHVRGIEGFVDLNVFRGASEEFLKM